MKFSSGCCFLWDEHQVSLGKRHREEITEPLSRRTVFPSLWPTFSLPRRQVFLLSNLCALVVKYICSVLFNALFWDGYNQQDYIFIVNFSSLFLCFFRSFPLCTRVMNLICLLYSYGFFFFSENVFVSIYLFFLKILLVPFSLSHLSLFRTWFLFGYLAVFSFCFTYTTNTLAEIITF